LQPLLPRRKALISGSFGMPRSPVRELFGHGDLVLQFTKREMEMRHKGSRLGHLWAILRPMTMLGLYLFVFGVLMGGRFGAYPEETTFDFAVALFLSISLFNVVLEAMAMAPGLVLNQPNFVKKVVFPLQIMPISSVATSLYHGLLSAVVALLLALCSKHAPGWSGIAALPVLLVPLTLFSLGISWALSAVGLFIRDVGQFIPFASQALLYASAVVYPPARIIVSAPRAWAVLRFNPFLHLMDEARRVILWHLPPHYAIWGYLYLTGALTAVIGYTVFTVLRPYFAEVL
jgi:lipopolysaccharide transport system permease protein